jgi:acyl-CoA synthetase (AMP-forming)/AMP-acid ligase II
VSTRTLADDLRGTAARSPDRCAVVDSTRALTYRDLLREAGGLATGLQRLGVRRGDRVAVVMRSSVDQAVAIYGIVLAGAAFVVLDATAPTAPLRHRLEHCGCVAVLADGATSARVRQAASETSARPHLVVSGAPEDGAVPFAALTSLPPSEDVGLLDVDLAAIIYTSGSTGDPKGATFLQRNVSFVADAVLSYLGLGPDDSVLSALPLSHTYGLYQLVMSVRVGARLRLLPAPVLPGQVVAALRDDEITVLPGVPTLWQLLLSFGAAELGRLPRLRLLTNAGAALPPAQSRALQELLPGAAVVAMYGQTECARVCYLPPGQLAGDPDSVGVPIPGTEAWVERDDGAITSPGEVGELVVRGDHVMQGYWRDPEGTAGKLVPGRLPGDRALRTGDLFRRDARGNLSFVARRDDMIVTRGEKVAPLEVERVLAGAAGVCEVAVLGVPDERQGMLVVAHVTPLPGQVLDVDHLRRHCAERLEPHKVPRYVVVHEALPRLGNGKLDRMALRQELVPG